MESTDDYKRSCASTDWAQEQFQQTYGNPRISKEDIFYYAYDLLHSPEYGTRFANELKKEMARIPFAKNFEAFTKASRELADWQLNRALALGRFSGNLSYWDIADRYLF